MPEITASNGDCILAIYLSLIDLFVVFLVSTASFPACTQFDPLLGF